MRLTGLSPPLLPPRLPIHSVSSTRGRARRGQRDSLSNYNPLYLVLTGRATSVRQIRRRVLGTAAAIGGQQEDWRLGMSHVHTDSTTTTWQYFFLTLDRLRWPAWPRRSGLLYFMLCLPVLQPSSLSFFLSLSSAAPLSTLIEITVY